MIYTDGSENGFRDASEMDEIVLDDIKSTYRKGAVIPSAVMFIICCIVWHVAFVTRLAMRMSVGTKVGIGIVSGLCALFTLVSFISSVVLLSKMKKKRFSWILGEITDYQFKNERSGINKYAIINSEYYCSMWNSPHYSVGTNVYFMSFGDGSSMKQNLIIKR